MREISPRDEPAAFTEWCAGSQNDINYGYDLIPGELRAEIKDALIAEQRGLCAYTGIRIDADSLTYRTLVATKALSSWARGCRISEHGGLLSGTEQWLRPVRRPAEGELAVARGATPFRFAPLSRL